MKAVRGVRMSLFVGLAVLVSLVAASSACAELVVGQLAPGSSPPTTCTHDSSYDELQVGVAGGNSYVVPVSGVLTSWSTNAGTEGGQSQGFKVFRSTGADSFQIVAEDTPRVLAPGVLNTFPIVIPVQAGDVIGIVYVAETKTACAFETGEAGDVLAYHRGITAPGGSLQLDPEDTESEKRVNLSATLLPPPTIGAITPASGSVKGASVVITGTNLAHVTGVSFGAVPAASFTSSSETQITAVSPVAKALGPVPITVTTVAGAAASAQKFTYEGCKVPRLNGKRLKAAKKKIRKADCAVGRVKKRGDATAKTGEVVKQNPKPGKLLVPGTKVKVVLEA